MSTDLTRDWPRSAADAARAVIDRYGPPDEAGPSLLIWYGRTPWRRMLVHRDVAPHRFPKPHVDVLEQVVAHQVPADKVSELARFNGSLVYERTRGELSCRCADEEGNLLALNLAHDIAVHGLDVAEARRRCYVAMQTRLGDERDPYLDRLAFTPAGAGDPDEVTLTAFTPGAPGGGQPR
ncbi:hypothetical protein [Phytohabitans rumicis]|uniref:Uncharacterized protein n=1 Tax=Phytohabitans rumicis TaxID=1076125 RepID=A0A6V8LIC3_9ACTN|nr:hypothetical protein [Phytohabitans rumicis]GFJ95300.1 hypothetical protein Prum_089420 [Phytohabitans rumicis]